MPSASLAVAHRPHPDRVRIAALSAAIAVNLAVLLAALRPMAPQFVESLRHPESMTLTWLTAPEVKPDPPPIDMAPAVKTPPTPHTRVAPRPAPPIAVPTDAGNVATPPVTATPAIEPTTTATPTADAAPVEATLAYRSSPLTFPSIAIRKHMHGTVLLRVLVDEDGKPVQVNVEQSSGEPVLDRSAREQVMANWRFQPATVQGRAVQAWARVPVSFELREL
ncbi:protein TonB [Dyella sp. OK004]|uniref:energy transducer TonB n=1 Tax=Dyella sp. OK004 TaxID=1855292 RepID=UPI0008EEB920|nr:energy transducer TonB [Dyella sp. OK004]SFS08658.1 protein TonB [Dyella sp. OK004]